MSRHLLLLIGHVSLGLGLVGIFLPLLPTTPFILLAAACYSRASARFDSWLRAHKKFGPLLIDWQHRGVIRRRAKIVATLCCGLSAAMAAIFGAPLIGLVMMGLSLSVVLAFIWTRPEF